MRLCWYLTSQYLQSLLTIDIIDQIDGRVQITHELYPFGSNFLYQIYATYLIEVIPSALGDFTKYVHKICCIWLVETGSQFASLTVAQQRQKIPSQRQIIFASSSLHKNPSRRGTCQTVVTYKPYNRPRESSTRHSRASYQREIFYNFNMATACDRFVIGSTTEFLVAYVLPDLIKTLGRWSLDSF